MVNISVIIPVYNLEDYVAKCIESCINQTHNDIEIICVNDGSKDQSLAILRQYELKDIRIRVIDTPNQGVVLARETGIAEAQGTYFTFIDGDDYIPPDALEALYGRAIETGADIVNGTVVNINRDEKKLIVRGNTTQNREEFIRNCFRNQDFYLHARLFKRELFGRRPFTCPPKITHNEDVIKILSLAFVAGSVASCPAEAYYYIFRQSSVSGSFSEKQYKHVLSVRKLVWDIFEKAGLREKYRSELVFFLMIALINIVRYGNAKKVLSIEDTEFLSLKNLFCGDVKQLLKKHQSKSEYRWTFPICMAPGLFIKITSAKR